MLRSESMRPQHIGLNNDQCVALIVLRWALCGSGDFRRDFLQVGTLPCVGPLDGDWDEE